MRRHAMVRVARLAAIALAVTSTAWAQGPLRGTGLVQRVEYRMRYQGLVEEQSGVWVGGEGQMRLGPLAVRLGSLVGKLSGTSAEGTAVSRTVRTTVAELGFEAGRWLFLAATGEARRFETDAGVSAWGLLGGSVRISPELGLSGMRAVVGFTAYPVRKASSGGTLQTAQRGEAGLTYAPGRAHVQALLLYRVERFDFGPPAGGGAERLEQFRGILAGVGVSLGR